MDEALPFQTAFKQLYSSPFKHRRIRRENVAYESVKLIRRGLFVDVVKVQRCRGLAFFEFLLEVVWQSCLYTRTFNTLRADFCSLQDVFLVVAAFLDFPIVIH